MRFAGYSGREQSCHTLPGVDWELSDGMTVVSPDAVGEQCLSN